MIVEGDLEPGSRILESEIALRLGVSRRTAQSALKRLQREGLISRPHGMRAPWIVAALTIRGFREIADVMEAILCQAAWRAAQLASKKREGLATDLRAINDEFRDACSGEPLDIAHVDNLDWRFHGHLVQQVGGTRMREIYEAQQPTMQRYGRYYVAHLIGTLTVSADEHAAIIDAIEQGQPDDAVLATRQNWSNACERYSEAIKDAGELGIL